MIIRAFIIETLLMLNFTSEPRNGWLVFGYFILGIIIVFATMLPFVGIIVVIGSGCLTFNYLHFIKEWDWISSIILGILISGLMGYLLTGGNKEKKNNNIF